MNWLQYFFWGIVIIVIYHIISKIAQKFGESEGIIFSTHFLEQEGGADVQSTEISGIVANDTEKYFRFRKGTYPYLDGVTKRYEDALVLLESRISKMKNIIDDQNRLHSQTKAQLRPLYSQTDIKRKQKEIEQLRESYNIHLNLFLELANLNTRLLVYSLYSRRPVTKGETELFSDYNKKKRAFMRSYRQVERFTS